MTVAEKALALVFAILVMLSLLACLVFVSISAFPLVTDRLSPFWNICFCLCSTVLAGWMILYAGMVRIGGGVMIFLKNPLGAISHPNSKGAHMHKSMFARILICSMSLAIAAVVMLAQDPGSKSAKTDHEPDFLQIITPHEGVDFTGFSADLMRVVKRNWYAKVASEAKQNVKGRVVVGFGIQKDGQLSNVPKVEVSSGNKALDEAAVSAVTASAPFEHLPEAFKGPNIDLRLTFLYNQPLSLR